MAAENTGQHRNPYAWNPVYWLTFLTLQIPVLAIRIVLSVVSSLFNKSNRESDDDVTTQVQTVEQYEYVQKSAFPAPAESEKFWQ